MTIAPVLGFVVFFCTDVREFICIFTLCFHLFYVFTMIGATIVLLFIYFKIVLVVLVLVLVAVVKHNCELFKND
jgi:hypothetical protein